MTIERVTIRENHEIYCKRGENEYGLTSPRMQGAVWSGAAPIPARGERVFVTMNGFGWGTVRGYFIEKGRQAYYQGVYVEPDNPPLWWIKQNKEDPVRCCMVFGAELDMNKKEKE